MSKRIKFCTVVTPDYLSQALSMVSSLLQTQKGDLCDIDVSIFVVGGVSGQEASLPKVSLRAVDEVIPFAALQELGKHYSFTELCCFLKPLVMEHLLETDCDAVLYVDSDLYFTGDIIEEFLANPSDIVLTPHVSAVGANDIQQVHSILKAGVFNAGFVGVCNSHEGKSFALWWKLCVSYSSKIFLPANLNADQRWLDMVPVIFPTADQKGKAGWNVGHWNIAEIAHSDSGQEWLEKVRFFHFSGYKPGSERFSIHSTLKVSDFPGLERVLAEYSERLDSFRKYDQKPNFTLVRSRWKRLLRHASNFLERSVNAMAKSGKDLRSHY
ncbi:hypothetical protein KUV22_01920 [Microbulbifer agarilyticus]|uniref:hypothetical protein n=1 Tax=Microbulbifer agarilyticus TaxID=260552 RepID=UPI001C975284|nr:hypothetical protein [Microbulbifer agarilyticus]MBY6189166.1 hypothetical protein [Microbulbifer agarilyticus]